MTPAELVLLVREHNARQEPADKRREQAGGLAAFERVTRGRAGG